MSININPNDLRSCNPAYHNFLVVKTLWVVCYFIGAIELNAVSEYYGVEINVADVQSGRIDRYGILLRTFLECFSS